jgi:hypothetical protein
MDWVEPVLQALSDALAVAEVLIWGLESILLYVVPANELRWKDAILLSMSMNLASFALGWFLTV